MAPFFFDCAAPLEYLHLSRVEGPKGLEICRRYPVASYFGNGDSPDLAASIEVCQFKLSSGVLVHRYSYLKKSVEFFDV